MGMPVVIDGDAAPDAIDEAFAWLRFVDATFSTYRADSEIRRLDSGALALADAHPLVREVLARCERLRARTGGYFDARATGPLDPSGLVKGWAVDRAAALLTQAGARRFCVNAGGDVVVRGGPWRVGVQHPRERDRVAAVLALTRRRRRDLGRLRARRAHPRPAHAPPGARRAVRHRARPRPRDRRRLRDGGVRDGRARAGLDRAAARLRRDDDPRRRPRALHPALPPPPGALGGGGIIGWNRSHRVMGVPLRQITDRAQSAARWKGRDAAQGRGRGARSSRSGAPPGGTARPATRPRWRSSRC